MQVAIIGTGNMGSGLASILAQAKHEVTIGSRDMAKAATLASQIGHGVVGGDDEYPLRLFLRLGPCFRTDVATSLMFHRHSKAMPFSRELHVSH